MARDNIRNFCIIAHIDHGKSTLSDRILELTKSVDERTMEDQILDNMDIERERGITIKARAVTMNYTAKDGKTYEFNLIDTPGHVDFAYEVSRSLAACEGAILVVDATQGVEAQTLANTYMALEHDLELVPILNKIDLPSAHPDEVAQEVEDVIGLPCLDAPRVSAKTGLNVDQVLERVVSDIPAPTGDPDAPLKALIFDSIYDSYKAVIVLSKRKLHKQNRTNYLNKREVTEQIQEGLDTIQEIKSYHQEAAYLNGLDEKIDKYEHQLTRSELLMGIAVNGSQSILKLGLASVIIVGASLVASGQTELFTYLIFMVIGSRIYTPINEVLNNLAALFYLDVRIDRMKEMEAMPVQHGEKSFNPNGYDIRFDHVSFSYEKGKQVLDNVSFTARQGEITALVGPSGSGKSTAAKLAARFWDATAGHITLGGTDISGIEPESLLKCFSIVFQDVTLFNTSVMENIRIGKREATDEEVRRVARLARCDEFVLKMPQGYQTVIGENGETLSGGERQRISIARALLKDAPIVLLDEATASLDVENETKIQAGISELVKHKTVLIIAHRMRTIAHADKIVVLKDGHVAETGNPEELKKQNGLFCQMMKRQVVRA